MDAMPVAVSKIYVGRTGYQGVTRAVCKKYFEVHVINLIFIPQNQSRFRKPPFLNPVMTVLASRIFSGLVFPTVRPGVSRTKTRLYASMQLSRICRVPHTAALTGAEGAFKHGMVCLLHW